MLIKLVGSGPELDTLSSLVTEAIASLGLTDTVAISTTDDEAYKMELGITENPALCIEEETIDFRDMIFEGVIPEKNELVSMLVSIVGVEETGGSCSSDGGCGSCGGGCH